MKLGIFIYDEINALFAYKELQIYQVLQVSLVCLELIWFHFLVLIGRITAELKLILKRWKSCGKQI